MMFGRQHGVPGTALFKKLCPCFGIVMTGRESSQLLHVILIRNVPVVKRPGLIDAIDRVNPPVDENSQFGIAKPLHPPVFFLCAITSKAKCGKQKHKNHSQINSDHKRIGSDSPLKIVRVPLLVHIKMIKLLH